MARRLKSERPDAKYRPKSKQRTFRKGDKMITVTTEVGPAIIDYADILAATEVVRDDDCYEAPWDDCEGWEHENYPSRQYRDRHPYHEMNEEDYRSQVGYYHGGSADSGVVVIDKDKARKDWFGETPYKGASKQVAAEWRAEMLKSNYETLVNWYNNGWEWWGVTCEFLDEHESVWRINDYDYAEKDVVPEIASQMVYALEEAGYTVSNKPDTKLYDEKLATRQRFLENTARKMGF